VRAVLAFVLVVAGAPLLAHHSFSDYYVEQDTIEVEGAVVEFQYQNPHAWVHIVSDDPFGRQRRYAAEWASRSRLQDDGVKKDTLKEGDRVRIWASPNRNPNDGRIRLKRIERRRDGWQWGQPTRAEER
jgi:hypothetical protein